MAPPADLLWTHNGIRCLMTRTPTGFEVYVQSGTLLPFIRKSALSRGDARNQGEYLRLLLDRSRSAAIRLANRPLVLIVEDDPDNLMAYEEMLKLEGFRIVSAANMADARRLAAQVKPAAVLLDHVLPDGSGTDLCDMLRQGHGEDLPIVLVTGLDTREIELGSRQCPDAVMSKPCRPDLLTALLRLLVTRGRPEEAGDEAPAAVPPRPSVHAMSVRCPLCGASGAQLGPLGQFTCAACGQDGVLRADQFIDTH